MKKLILGALFILSCDMAYAHNYWLTVDNFAPRPGEEITLSVCFGHQFPDGPEARAENVEKLYIIDPDGVETPLAINAEGETGTVAPIKIRLTKKGTHYAVMIRKPGFVCKTTKGYIHKPKNELEGVISSSWSEASAVAVITVGSSSGRNPGNFAKNQRFQVVPLVDPGSVKVGDTVTVQYLLDDEPFRTWVHATYAGFSREKDTFAYAARIQSDTMTAKIRILHGGIWIIMAKDAVPYENPEKADDFSFGSTLTFEVK